MQALFDFCIVLNNIQLDMELFEIISEFCNYLKKSFKNISFSIQKGTFALKMQHSAGIIKYLCAEIHNCL